GSWKRGFWLTGRDLRTFWACRRQYFRIGLTRKRIPHRRWSTSLASPRKARLSAPSFHEKGTWFLSDRVTKHRSLNLGNSTGTFSEPTNSVPVFGEREKPFAIWHRGGLATSEEAMLTSRREAEVLSTNSEIALVARVIRHVCSPLRDP